MLLRNHGLHLEIRIDADDAIGKSYPAGVKDVLVEAALTTIEDCEDSVAAVDAKDDLAPHTSPHNRLALAAVRCRQDGYRDVPRP